MLFLLQSSNSALARQGWWWWAKVPRLCDPNQSLSRPEDCCGPLENVLAWDMGVSPEQSTGSLFQGDDLTRGQEDECMGGSSRQMIVSSPRMTGAIPEQWLLLCRQNWRGECQTGWNSSSRSFKTGKSTFGESRAFRDACHTLKLEEP